MQTLNNAELAFLSLLAYPKLGMETIKVYAGGATLFPPAIWPHLSKMWEAYLNTLKTTKESGKKISRDIIAANLSEVIQADTNLPVDLKEKSDHILQRIVTDQVPTLEEGSNFLQNVVRQETLRKVATSVIYNPDFEQLQNTINRGKLLSDGFTQKEDTHQQIVYHPLREMPNLAVYQKRIPTGINWLDELTSGGGREGELWLILGGTGQGKTSLTVQYAVQQALMGNSTLWATYEQAVEGDIAERIIANVTDTSLDQIRDRGFDNLDEEIQRKFWASVAGADEKLIIMDMTKLQRNNAVDPLDNGGMYTIWQQYKKLKDEGKAPKTIIVDWIGAMMSGIGALTGRDLSKSFRFMTQAEIDIARRMVKEEPLQIIFFHQTDSVTQKQRPTYLADKTASKDMRDLAHYMDIEIILGNRDINNILYVQSAKSRKGNPIVRTVKLIGDKCKFVLAPGWIPNSDGNFYNPAENVMENPIMDKREEGVSEFKREID